MSAVRVQFMTEEKRDSNVNPRHTEDSVSKDLHCGIASRLQKRRRILRWMLIAFCVLLSVSLIAAWVVGGKLIAPANRPVLAPSDLPFAEFTIESDSGSTIAGWSLSKERGDPVVILLHPIRSNRTAMLERARLFHESGFSIIMIDLQAHGESPGENITLGYLEKHDVVESVGYAKEKFPESKIGVVGCSLGGASALLGSPLGVDAMVLESVYPTVSEAVYDRIDMRIGPLKHLAAPLLLAQLPMRLGISIDDLRPIDFMSQVECPVLICAGDQDLHTPMEESQMIFDAANEPKQMLTFSGASHEDLLAYDSDLYRDKVVEFLRKNLESDP